MTLNNDDLVCMNFHLLTGNVVSLKLYLEFVVFNFGKVTQILFDVVTSIFWLIVILLPVAFVWKANSQMC